VSDEKPLGSAAADLVAFLFSTWQSCQVMVNYVGFVKSAGSTP
jgi:hypothetical protein